MTPRYEQILGVRFLIGSAEDAIGEVARDGGLVVVPSAPALCELTTNRGYRDAALGAKFAITDSALMVLVWNLISRKRISKLSGLKYLRALVADPQFRQPHASFWVMPTPRAQELNLKWLNSQGIQTGPEDTYLAPIYGREIEDRALLAILEETRPAHVVLGVGGGTQEPLGHYLIRNLSYSPAIHCIGAAIGFLTGDQVAIPVWVDALGLGWLWRTFSNPSRFGKRYWQARHLVPLMLRYRDRLPEADFPRPE